ncbi:Uncharacterised protein [Slackia heliotrinireducens]|uniref:Uncharacterized protein n=1 Tax=Slackia heliotrinireducens (strain ATCC 29202 / DSM 20476 / NCTC 11029 / RHS 1) TaxID=471855 RepID=C7N129_SLAHD|nr:ABC transporter permease [Slackia heliotrinireducens]ACV23251.1 hypothetical protein Shel_22410 [Slackia heliotrinireducens DSM 20476]VEH02395.1 Uncharacterised protein [Slackia heliotrinireducens]
MDEYDETASNHDASDTQESAPNQAESDGTATSSEVPHAFEMPVPPPPPSPYGGPSEPAAASIPVTKPKAPAAELADKPKAQAPSTDDVPEAAVRPVTPPASASVRPASPPVSASVPAQPATPVAAPVQPAQPVMPEDYGSSQGYYSSVQQPAPYPVPPANPTAKMGAGKFLVLSLCLYFAAIVLAINIGVVVDIVGGSPLLYDLMINITAILIMAFPLYALIVVIVFVLKLKR